MADNLTDAGENLALDYLLSLVDQVRLVTVNGTDAAAGTEVVGGSYAPATGVTWAAASGGASSNTSAIAFTSMPAVTVVGVELWDTTTTPTRIWYGPLTTSRTFTAGDNAEFAAGDLDVSIS